MKLYATVTSERATKGQGGNKFLQVQFMDEKREIMGTISIKPVYAMDTDTILSYWLYGTFMGETIDIDKRGKKQKDGCQNYIHQSHEGGDMCPDCKVFWS